MPQHKTPPNYTQPSADDHVPTEKLVRSPNVFTDQNKFSRRDG